MRDSGCFDFLLRINQPVVMARHGFGDQYRATEIKFDGAGTIKLSFQPEGRGPAVEHEVFKAPGADVGSK